MGEPLPPVRFEPLNEGHNCGGFSCTNPEITNWVQNSAHRDHAKGGVRVTCAFFEGQNRPVGVYALATVAEAVENLPGYFYHRFRSGQYFSALQLVWLATDRGFTGRGLGKLMVGHAIRRFADIGTQIGIPHLILIPADQDKERLTEFYAGLGFSQYSDGAGMFLSLQSVRDAIEKQSGAV